jgi:hypothetical protein
MKKIIIPILVFATFLNTAKTVAQDVDTNIASHDLEVTVNEIALLDVYDANTGVESEAGTVKLEINTDGTENQEAGLYDFADYQETNFYLNYTSVVSEPTVTGVGANTSRTISVKLLTDSKLPGSTKLVISATEPTMSNSTNGNPGSLENTELTFNQSDITAGSSKNLVEKIQSVYTGDGAFGVKLTYNLEQEGDFSNFKAGTYTSTIQYTLSDL